MWTTVILTLFIAGAMASYRFNVFGMLFLSIAGFAMACSFGWLLSYSLGSNLILAITGLIAVQSGFFSGLLAQVWLVGRSANTDQHQFPAGKADVHAPFS